MINPQEIFAKQFCHVSSSVYTWAVPTNLAYFEGHFPENPVLPAIAMIDLSLEAISQNLSRSVKLKKISQAKFLKVIVPGSELKIKVEKISSEEWVVIWCEFKDELKILAKINMRVM